MTLTTARPTPKACYCILKNNFAFFVLFAMTKYNTVAVKLEKACQ